MKRILIKINEDGEVLEQAELRDWYKRGGAIVSIGKPFALLDLSKSAWTVFQYVICNMKYVTNCCDCSAKQITDHIGISYRSTLRAIYELERKSVIKKSKSGFIVNPRYIMRGNQVLKSTLEGFDDEER